MTQPTAPYTILLIDNTPSFVESLRWFLTEEGYCVVTADNHEIGRAMLERGPVDLAVLDIRLINDKDEKDISGLELAKTVQTTIPKIIYSNFPSYEAARIALGPRAEGLPPAVDFLGKEEGPQTLLTAIRHALLLFRRSEQQPNPTPQPEPPAETTGEIWVDPQTRQVYVVGQPIEVTPQEFELMRYFVSRPNQVVSRAEIVQEVLGQTYEGVIEENRVNNIIRRLRQKIEPNEAVNPHYLQTVRGHGFKLVLRSG
jgi:DNA-binding response OmpR family regulator